MFSYEGEMMTSRSAAYSLYSGSYAFVDGVEDVTFTPAGSGSTPVTAVKALRGNWRREAATGVVVKFEPETLEFVLWDATLAGAAPAGGDLITDGGGNRFRVVSAQRQMWDTQWRCLCQAEV